MVRRLLTGSALQFFQLVISAGIGFFMLPFMISRLGNEMYGLWVLAGSFSAAYGLLDLGLSVTTSRFIAVALARGNLEQANRYVSTSFFLFCLMGGLVVLAAGGVASFASLFVRVPAQATSLTYLIIIIGFEFGISFPMRSLIGAVNAKLRYDATAGTEIAFRLLSAAGIVAILLTGGSIVQLALFSLGLGMFKILVWNATVRRISPEIQISSKMASRQVVWSFFSFSTFACIYQIADLLRFKIDNFVIAAYLGPSDVTHYAIATTLTTYLVSSTVAIMGVLAVVFSHQHGRDDQEAMRRTLHFGLRASTSIVSFMGFGLVAWGSPFIDRWMGPQYRDSYPCLVVIVIGLIVALWQTSGVSALYSNAKHHLLAISNTVEAAANLVCSIVFVQYWGIFGVALGTSLPMILIKLTFQPFLVSRALGIRLRHYFLWLLQAVFFVCIALIIPAIITYYCRGPAYSDLLLTAAFCTLAYFPVVGILNFSTQERYKVWKAVTRIAQ